MGLGRDLRRVKSLPIRTWADLATAAAELAFARLRLAAHGAEDLVRDEAARGSSHVTEKRNHSRTIERVAFAIPRMGARVPWHSTCLVQAIAAQHWLKRNGIRSSISLGARKHSGEAIDAHAWLEAEGRLVVGGDVEGYARFTPSRRG
jgi:hypothetical protein